MSKIPSIAATAICLAFATGAFAGDAGSTKSQTDAMAKCKGLQGDAFEKCRRDAAPGKSEGSASRSGGAEPGRSGDASSRSGTPPGAPGKKY